MFFPNQKFVRERYCLITFMDFVKKMRSFFGVRVLSRYHVTDWTGVHGTSRKELSLNRLTIEWPMYIISYLSKVFSHPSDFSRYDMQSGGFLSFPSILGVSECKSSKPDFKLISSCSFPIRLFAKCHFRSHKSISPILI